MLEGAAAKAIQGLTLSDANYDSAVDLLRERFGKSQAIITAHMEELLKVPGCTSDHSHSLRSVYDKIIIHVRGLESLEVTPDQYGSLLIPIILLKFIYIFFVFEWLGKVVMTPGTSTSCLRL